MAPEGVSRDSYFYKNTLEMKKYQSLKALIQLHSPGSILGKIGLKLLYFLQQSVGIRELACLKLYKVDCRFIVDRFRIHNFRSKYRMQMFQHYFTWA
ncbi:hypothetical protein ASG93_31955 [Paenibacillus sp. Soil787]|nr:hypothetical protein ASG93_31955 [Paenibacillus sp. Soil787]